MTAFPAHHQLNAQGYLDPHQAPPIIYLQNARLMLHRQNMGMKNPPEIRLKAINSCVRVAKDTARLLSRCMQPPPRLPTEPHSQDSWRGPLLSAASAFLCTHIWRCALFLAYRADYESALICAQAGATMDSARPVNAACGRYLDFFLKKLVTRIDGDRSFNLDADEEILALVSGDLQGSAENSWVWIDKEREGTNYRSHGSQFSPVNPTPVTAQDDVSNWSQWDNILSTLRRLLRDERQRMTHLMPEIGHSQTAVHLASPVSPGDSEGHAPTSNRIRIADIM